MVRPDEIGADATPLTLTPPKDMTPEERAHFMRDGEVRPAEVVGAQMSAIDHRKVNDFLAAVSNVDTASYYTTPHWEARNKFVSGDTKDPLWLHQMKEVPLGNYNDNDLHYKHLMDSAIFDLYQQLVPPREFNIACAIDIEQLRLFTHIQGTRGREFAERKANITRISESRGESTQTIRTPESKPGILSRLRGRGGYE